MNSIEKKLDALIDALGFDIEEFHAIGEKYDGKKGLGNFEFIDNGDVHGYYAIEINYKLTDRKPACVPLPIQSDAWGCVVDFLTSHNDDIENDINDYGTLKPILNFINGNSNE